MKCKTKFCRNQTNGRNYCSTCRTRRWRQRNFIKYIFHALKHNAKRRGKRFELTLEQFTTFCQATNYIRGKGKTQLSYSIDRIDNTKGYTIDNIQILTLSENSAKGTKTLHYDYQTGNATVHYRKHNQTIDF